MCVQFRGTYRDGKYSIYEIFGVDFPIEDCVDNINSLFNNLGVTNHLQRHINIIRKASGPISLNISNDIFMNQKANELIWTISGSKQTGLVILIGRHTLLSLGTATTVTAAAKIDILGDIIPIHLTNRNKDANSPVYSSTNTVLQGDDMNSLSIIRMESAETYKESLLAMVATRWQLFDENALSRDKYSRDYDNEEDDLSKSRHNTYNYPGESTNRNIDIAISPNHEKYLKLSPEELIKKTKAEFREAVGFIANLASKNLVQQRERMSLNEAITKSEALAETIELKRLFVRTVSHEIRTPLSIVLSGIYLLETLTSNSSDMQVTDVVNEMKVSCKTAIDTLNDLLTYEKLDEDLLDVVKKPIVVCDILREQVQMFTQSAAQLDINLTFEVNTHDSLLQILADEQKIAHVFRNLISNGIKFTPTLGAVTVRLLEKSTYDIRAGKHFKLPSAKDVQSWVRIEVQDTGTGLSEESQMKLMSELSQFNPKELQTGQGCGLSFYTSRGIIDLHGGLMGVSSEGEGRGATFFTELPVFCTEIKSMHVIADQYGSSSKSSGAPLPSFKQKMASFQRKLSMAPTEDSSRLRLLIVDDAISIRKMIIRMIKDQGYSYAEAKNGAEAVALVEQSIAINRPFDCILMDSSMPVMTGPEATEIIRQKLGFKGKIFGVTGNALQGDIDDFLSKGLDDIMLKPLRPEALLKLLVDAEAGNTQGTLVLQTSSPLECQTQPPTHEAIDQLIGDQIIADDYKPSALIVDDALPCRKTIIRVIQEYCLYAEARNGEEAVHAVQQALQMGTAFDYILMDYAMPVLDGASAVKAIREMGYRGAIIGLAGSGVQAEIDTFAALGVTKVLVKPINPDELLAVLELAAAAAAPTQNPQ